MNVDNLRFTRLCQCQRTKTFRKTLKENEKSRKAKEISNFIGHKEAKKIVHDRRQCGEIKLSNLSYAGSANTFAGVDLQSANCTTCLLS